jgi:hypothetical protein
VIIGTVVEGPTDRLVLQAVLNRLLPGQHRYLPLQPTETFGERGTGWKGVRRWCYETWQREDTDLDKLLSGDSGPALDLLVIHVDADVAAEHDLNMGGEDPVPDVRQPCPPIGATADRLALVVAQWLKRSSLPVRVILAIPAQDTENWTFAALFPGDELCKQEDYECIKTGRDRPAYRLTLKKYGKRLRRTSEGTIKKPVVAYRELTPHVAAAWDVVCGICTQAQRFTADVYAVVSETEMKEM